jgi:hypothetical protein
MRCKGGIDVCLRGCCQAVDTLLLLSGHPPASWSTRTKQASKYDAYHNQIIPLPPHAQETMPSKYLNCCELIINTGQTQHVAGKARTQLQNKHA